MALVEVVKKAIKGDKESFSMLIQERKEQIYKIAYSYVNNVDDALDIVQDVIYKALISIKDLKQPEYFNTWIIRITINYSINHLRKYKRIVYMDENHVKSMCTNFSNNEELKEDNVKNETMYSVRTASQPFGEGIGQEEEILYNEKRMRVLKDSNGTFCVEVGIYKFQEEAEKKLKDFNQKYGTQLKFFIEERIGTDMPKLLK